MASVLFSCPGVQLQEAQGEGFDLLVRGGQLVIKGGPTPYSPVTMSVDNNEWEFNLNARQGPYRKVDSRTYVFTTATPTVFYYVFLPEGVPDSIKHRLDYVLESLEQRTPIEGTDGTPAAPTAGTTAGATAHAEEQRKDTAPRNPLGGALKFLFQGGRPHGDKAAAPAPPAVHVSTNTDTGNALMTIEGAQLHKSSHNIFTPLVNDGVFQIIAGKNRNHPASFKIGDQEWELNKYSKNPAYKKVDRRTYEFATKDDSTLHVITLPLGMTESDQKGLDKLLDFFAFGRVPDSTKEAAEQQAAAAAAAKPTSEQADDAIKRQQQQRAAAADPLGSMLKAIADKGRHDIAAFRDQMAGAPQDEGMDADDPEYNPEIFVDCPPPPKHLLERAERDMKVPKFTVEPRYIENNGHRVDLQAISEASMRDRILLNELCKDPEYLAACRAHTEEVCARHRGDIEEDEGMDADHPEYDPEIFVDCPPPPKHLLERAERDMKVPKFTIEPRYIENNGHRVDLQAIGEASMRDGILLNELCKDPEYLAACRAHTEEACARHRGDIEEDDA